jgi:VanZ family protein
MGMDSKKIQSAVVLLFVAESMFLVYMAFQPGYAVPSFHIPFLRGGDMEHLLAYLVYGFLALGAFARRFMGRELILLAIGWCCLFAGLTEGIQAFVPSRFADPADWVVDVLGSSAGILVSRKDVLTRRLGFQKRGPL